MKLVQGLLVLGTVLLAVLGTMLYEHNRLSRSWQRSLDDRLAIAIERLQKDILTVSFSLGMPSRPADIIKDDVAYYERSAQGWGGNADTQGKQEVPCTIDGSRDKIAVIVILGQSNAANHGSGTYVAKNRVDNFDIYSSKCFKAADPLLGPSGKGANFATRLGDILIERRLFERVIIASIAMGSTTVEHWAEEGMFNPLIGVLVRKLHDANLSPDFILWHQGEGNPGVGDSNGRQYRKNLLEVIRTFRQYGVTSPFFVALTTRCGGAHLNAENIRNGQRSATNRAIGIFLGPDTDQFDNTFRYDQCHFNEIGLDRHAAAWADVLAEFISSSRPAGIPARDHIKRSAQPGDR